MPSDSNLPRGRARRRITLADVAREVGVSTMTASRAISRPELVTRLGQLEAEVRLGRLTPAMAVETVMGLLNNVRTGEGTPP